MTDINRLAAERDKLTAELEGMDLSPQAAKAVAAADLALAEHDAKVAALKAKRDSLDERFDITRQREAAARRQARIERRDAQCREMIAIEENRLEHIQAAERHLQQVVANLGAAFAAHNRLRELANGLTEGAKLHALGALSPTEFESRVAAFVRGILQGIENMPGKPKGYPVGRIGMMELTAGIEYRLDLGWRATEERRVAPGIEAVIAYAQGEFE